MPDAMHPSHEAPGRDLGLLVALSGRHPDATPPNNLPLQLSSFVGRKKELAEVKRLLQGSRLLTLTGSGGSSKSRLAVVVAFWKRSLVWGMAVVNAAILFKIGWTFLFSIEAGAMSHLPAAVLGLVVCDALILYAIRRMRRRPSR